MKTIGMVGGMSWESTAEYYRIVNEECARRLGGLHSAKCVLVSVDFHEIEAMQANDDWEAAALAVSDAARSCEAAGADFVVLCTNTMHKVVPQASDAVGIPFLHIADATARRIREAGYTRVGLLGTAYTMEGAFYRSRLEEQHGLDVLVPDQAERTLVHRIIYDELVKGVIREASREVYRRVVRGLAARGAQAVIAGCTEIGLLVKQADSPIPLFDTTRIHAEEAVRFAIE